MNLRNHTRRRRACARRDSVNPIFSAQALRWRSVSAVAHHRDLPYRLYTESRLEDRRRTRPALWYAGPPTPHQHAGRVGDYRWRLRIVNP